MCIYITESLCCTAEISTALQVNYASIIKNKEAPKCGSQASQAEIKPQTRSNMQSSSAFPSAFSPGVPHSPEGDPGHFKHEPRSCCLIAVVVFIRHEDNFFYTLKGNDGRNLIMGMEGHCNRHADRGPGRV